MKRSARLRVALDVDGVLADIVPAWRAACRMVCGKPDFDDMLDTYDGGGWGLTPEEMAAAWEHIGATPNFWLGLQPLEGLPLFELDRQFDLYFITSRRETLGRSAYHQTAKWIYRYYNIFYPRAIVTGNKPAVCAALGIQWMLDDNPSIAESLLGTGTQSVLRAHPYNRQANPEIPRADSVADFFSRYVGVQA